MWGSLLAAFLSDIPSSFQYNIGSPVESQTIGGLFKLTTASHKSNKHDQLSAFVFERKANNAYDETQRVMKMAKSIRHPYIVSVRDVLETSSGNLYIVSEQAEPLSMYLARSDNNRHVARETIIWNLKCIAEALIFLHQANIIHRAMCLETIFVCSDGQWKLGIPEMGWDLSNGTPKPIEESSNPLKVLYESEGPYSIQPIPVLINSQAADRYMLGCTLAVFWSLCIERGQSKSASFPPLNSVKWNLKSNRVWTKSPIESYIRALTENSDAMPDGTSLWQEGTIVPVMTFFQNYALQNSWDLEKFFEATFPKALDSSKFTDPRVRALVYLPKLSRILAPREAENINTLPAHVRPQALRVYAKLLQDCSLLSKDAFDEIGWRTLSHLYHDSERATRFMLLSSIESYANHLDATQIQQIFEEVLAGLLDSSQELRDVTLRGITVLLPRLIEANYAGSVEKALRVISGLIQTDRAPGIRTNAAVCLSKVCLMLKTKHVHSRISPGLKSATSDAFAPCRLAGLEGLRKVAPYIPLRELATDYLPAVCPRLIDDDMSCRLAANKFVAEAVELLLDKGDNSVDTMATPHSLPSAQSLRNAVSVTMESFDPVMPDYLRTGPMTPSSLIAQTVDGIEGAPQDLSPPENADEERKQVAPLINHTAPKTHFPPNKAGTCTNRKTQDIISSSPKPDPSEKFWQEVNNANNEVQPNIKRSLGAARRTNVNRRAA